ncbi:prefoldin subunit 5 isoform X2 [Lycium barbarum]|uniref:prefoldin subunit 5 isoform X2 n=1 Tax=Lycium barbarum TaxID=112863 RepID=UPI00293F155B|nr:prefoldin subunit 5 isoform X2 [Lycium barbarum]
MASPGSGGRTLEIEKMSVEQLKALKEQADLEVNLLQDSLNNIRTATSRLEIASNALQDLSLRPQGKKMLVCVPLVLQNTLLGVKECSFWPYCETYDMGFGIYILPVLQNTLLGIRCKRKCWFVSLLFCKTSF